jgi:hypothetical protein
MDVNLGLFGDLFKHFTLEVDSFIKITVEITVTGYTSLWRLGKVHLCLTLPATLGFWVS